MNFFELVEQSAIGREQAKKLKENVSANVHCEFIERINEVLSSLDENQQKIVKQKFSNFDNLSQLYDKLYEILVAYRFFNKKPIFCDDANGGPDLFLEKTGEYVEVKSINNSDVQNDALEFMQKNNNRQSIKKTFNPVEESRKKSAVVKKVFEHINKACKQLRDKKGVIVLVYKIDTINNSNITGEDIENRARTHFQSLNLKDVSFEMIHKNELFGN